MFGLSREKVDKMSTAEVLKLALLKIYIYASCVCCFWLLLFIAECIVYTYLQEGEKYEKRT